MPQPIGSVEPAYFDSALVAKLAEVRDLFAGLERSVYLRSLDALHLVTAKSEQFRRVYTNDQHLLRACGHVGLEGIDPT